jgi:hypothetical protein
MGPDALPGRRLALERNGVGSGQCIPARRRGNRGLAPRRAWVQNRQPMEDGPWCCRLPRNGWRRSHCSDRNDRCRYRRLQHKWKPGCRRDSVGFASGRIFSLAASCPHPIAPRRPAVAFSCAVAEALTAAEGFAGTKTASGQEHMRCACQSLGLQLLRRAAHLQPCVLLLQLLQLHSKLLEQHQGLRRPMRRRNVQPLGRQIRSLLIPRRRAPAPVPALGPTQS